ncbi:hypothetical protein INT48_006174 [Thamnidium elegans]|uniref:Uncharacterized protein n=1 Tax=Thamnidium elegans TaxID=101142 RepID=A0A8H7SQW5_9FUNG|nr:hypothetical protein INT48_006174 [Thamnidium elegans]
MSNNNNNTDLPWNMDSTNLLQDVFDNAFFDAAKLDFLIGEVSEIKSMLSRLLDMNSRNSFGFSFNPVSLGSGSRSVSTSRLQINPSSFEILNSQEKVDDIVSEAESNRGKRCYGRSNVSLKTGVATSNMKNLITAMCALWLEKENVTYGMATTEEDHKARHQDANASQGFRWSVMSREDRERMALVVEHIVLETLTNQACLPLNCAEDSWVACYLLSVANHNEGSRKAGRKSNVAIDVDKYLSPGMVEEVELPQ